MAINALKPRLMFRFYDDHMSIRLFNHFFEIFGYVMVSRIDLLTPSITICLI